MQNRINRPMEIFVSCVTGVLVTFFLSLASCKKTAAPVKNSITPLQSLINSDTSLTLFHRLLLQGNDAGLLTDTFFTLLIPTNAALRSAGYSEKLIDSTRATRADNLVRYHFINSRANIHISDNSAYTPYTTLLGYAVYGMSDRVHIWFNGIQANGDPTPVGKALVYRLSSILQAPVDSLNHLLAGDTSLSFLAKAFTRTRLYDSLLSGNFTLLAPVNDAFRNAGYDSVKAVDQIDSASLIRLTKNHVVNGTYFTNILAGRNMLSTLAGGSIVVSLANDVLQFKGSGSPAPAALLRGNQTAGNKIVVHRISQLLFR